jgi:hypothetical protein
MSTHPCLLVSLFKTLEQSHLCASLVPLQKVYDWLFAKLISLLSVSVPGNIAIVVNLPKTYCNLFLAAADCSGTGNNRCCYLKETGNFS